MIRFLQPWGLLSLLPVMGMAGGYLWRQWRRRMYAVRFSNLALLRTIAPAQPGWRRHLSAGAFLLALLALALAVARPAMERQEPMERATVMLAIDVSLSMEATDVAPSRLQAAQQAAVDFVRQLPDRHQVGLVSFARTAQVVVSPTTDRDEMVRGIENLRLAEATATGEAVFAALEAIRQVPSDGAEGPPPARILLLTDGYRTYGRTVEEAARAAVAAGVPVSTIAFGTDQGVVDIGGQLYRVPVDRESMARLAEDTGGRFYEAATAAELSAVYEDMGSSIGYRTVPYEITQWMVAGALGLGLLAGGLSLRWTPRLP
ncbi:MAG TPA: VWA domain-containing protein [Natronosporangium sp.]|nr:VWA domain-containing protein [Natronosporangium sp.]